MSGVISYRLPVCLTGSLGHVMRIGFAIGSLLVIFWWASALWNEANKPSLYSAATKAVITVPDGENVIIGRRELIQPSGATSAEKKHLRFFTDDFNDLWLSSEAKTRRLYLEIEGWANGIYSDRYLVDTRPGFKTVLSLGPVEIGITRKTAHNLSVEISSAMGQSQQYSLSLAGRGRNINEELLEACAEGFNFSVPPWLREMVGNKAKTVAEFGGTKACNYSRKALLPTPEIDEEISFNLIHSNDGNLYLAAGRNTDRVPVGFKTYKGSKLQRKHDGARGLAWRVAERNSRGELLVESFIAGRTKYDIIATPEPGSWKVSLNPVNKIPFFDADFCRKAQAEPIRYPDADEICPPEVAHLGHTLIPTALHRLLAPMDYVSKEGIFVLFLCFLMIIVLSRSLIRVFGAHLFMDTSSGLEVLAIVLTIVALLIPIVLYLAFQTSGGYPHLALYVNFIALFVPYAAVSIVLMLDRPGGILLSVFWFFLVLVVAIGALSMFTLSAEGFNSGWERYFVKHKNLILLTMAPAFLIVSLYPSDDLQFFLGNELAAGQSLGRSVFFYLVLVVILGFVLWGTFGTQTGLAELFQPVELGKFMVVVVLGSVVAQILIQTRIFSPVWVAVNGFLVFAVGLFLVALFVAPLLKSDWSPLFIVLITSFVVFYTGFFLIVKSFCWEAMRDKREMEKLPRLFNPRVKPFRRRWWRFGGTTFLLACLLIMPYLCRNQLTALAMHLPEWSWDYDPKQQIDKLQNGLGEGRRVPITRWMSFLDLQYPEVVDPEKPPKVKFVDLGYQSLRSRATIAAAPCAPSPTYREGWFGAEITQVAETIIRFFGACSEVYNSTAFASHESLACTPRALDVPALPHCIPVIESDFAATYLITRHGRATAALLLIAQIGLIIPLLATYVILQGKTSRDPVITGANQSLGLIALGGAVLLFLQWNLAWANSFTLLPVMGQPMTWLSAGTSHHLFMAIPITLAAVCAIRVAGVQRTRYPFGQPPRL